MTSINRKKIGLFGGSFDPIHNGHLGIAQKAYQDCALDKIIFIPSWKSPHKDSPFATEHDRLCMLKLALQEHTYAEISTFELNQKKSVYSWKTAEFFSREYAAELYWILGSDQWKKLSSWNRPDYLHSLVHFLVFSRGEKIPLSHHEETVTFLETHFEISSTKIRQRIKKKKQISQFVPYSVLEYIQRNHLYTP